MEMKKFNNMTDKNFQKSLKKKCGCPEGCFLRVWVSKRLPDALLAKTMLEATCFCVWSTRQCLIISGAVLCCTARHLDGLIGSGRGC